MMKNIGTLDAVVRVVGGVAILWIGLDRVSLWGAAGLILILTAVAGRCPVYRLFGWSTRARSEGMQMDRSERKHAARRAA